MCSLEKCLFRSSANFWIGLFVSLILSCTSCVYTFELIFCQLLHLQTFSPMLKCLFILFMVSFAVQKLLNLNRSHLFIFVFIFITLGGGSKKMLLQFLSKSVLFRFSSKSFIVSGFIFRSLIHFEFIFVYGVRECSNFILLHVAVQFIQHHLLKRFSFLHCIFLPPLSQIRWP